MTKQEQILLVGFKEGDSLKQYQAIKKALDVSYNNAIEGAMASEFLINLRDYILTYGIY